MGATNSGELNVGAADVAKQASRCERNFSATNYRPIFPGMDVRGITNVHRPFVPGGKQGTQEGRETRASQPFCQLAMREDGAEKSDGRHLASRNAGPVR